MQMTIRSSQTSAEKLCTKLHRKIHIPSLADFEITKFTVLTYVQKICDSDICREMADRHTDQV